MRSSVPTPWLLVGPAGADVHAESDPSAPVLTRLAPESLVTPVIRPDKTRPGWIAVRVDGGRLGFLAPDANVHALEERAPLGASEGLRERPDRAAPSRRGLSPGSPVHAARVLVGTERWWVVRDRDGFVGWSPDGTVVFRDPDVDERIEERLHAQRRIHEWIGNPLAIVALGLLIFASIRSDSWIPAAVVGGGLVLRIVLLAARASRRRAERSFRPW